MELTRVGFHKSLAVSECKFIGYENAIGNETPRGLRNVMRSLERELDHVLVVCDLFNPGIERANQRSRCASFPRATPELKGGILVHR